MLPNALAKRPHTAESDFTGIVVAAQGVTGFDIGEAVCGWISQREFTL
jgi:NADPH:quinone reductase-like Zn-dependent oxidoreductase